MSENGRETSRRELLRVIGGSMVMTAGGSGVLSPLLAQHVHQMVHEEKSLDTGGNYTPKALTRHEYDTLRALSDLILPADEHSPGALAGGAPEFIDFLCSRSDEMREIYSGGLAWLDNASHERFGAAFLRIEGPRRMALLDLIAYRKNLDDPSLAAGVHFFSWARNMVVDAFYTSPAGVQDLGYIGNTARTEFSVPAEAIAYALNRSPFRPS